MDFNLLVEPWIPVIYHDGRYDRLGIKRTLSDAHRIRQIAASNPMDRLAILRFLLALLYWCKGNPAGNNDRHTDEPIPSDWFRFLDDHEDCFHLFGPGLRFFQDATARRPRPTSDLVHEIPTGNNFWHFCHATDGEQGLCPACCTLGLIRLPLFSVSGLPDLRAGINGTPPIYVIALGCSLSATLFENWKSVECIGDPSWAANPMEIPTSPSSIPMLTGLTLPARRVWLHDPVEQLGRCFLCGASGPIVKGCEYQSAGEQYTERWTDPHVLYLEGSQRKALKAADPTAAGKFRTDKPWAEQTARIVSQNTSANVRYWVVSFATHQAKFIDVWEQVFEVSALEQGYKAVFEWKTTLWQKETAATGRRLKRRPEDLPRGSKSNSEGIAFAAMIRPHIESRVRTRLTDLIANPQNGWLKAADEYRPMMTAVATSLSPDYTTKAVQRREKIAGIKPDMSLAPSVSRTKTSKKGKRR